MCINGPSQPHPVPHPVEAHTIHPIPRDQRHGRVGDLFSVWFSANMTLLTVVTGTLGPVVFGLSFFWSFLALLLGNMTGAVFMALHAAQGPRLGVPQMVQSRGQFGLYGAVPVIFLVILMYIGFAASNCVVGGEALVQVLQQAGSGSGFWMMTRMEGIMLVALLTLLPCILGYRAIHLVSKYSSRVSACVVVFGIFSMFNQLSPDFLADTHGSVAGFFGAFSVAALWQIAYAPYVSDSSRYLPWTALSSRKAFWASYGGTVTGAVLPMILGCILALQWPGRNVAQALAESMGAPGLVLLLVLALAIPLANAMSVYCGALCSLTLIQGFWPCLRFGMWSRIGASCVLIALALFMSLGMARDFLASYTEFLDVLMAVLVPWTAINLTDYYLLKHGNYDVSAFFASDGGVYGRWNVPAITCYLLGVLVELPLMKTGPFTGPLVASLHDIDLSWVAGLVVTTLAYAGWEVSKSRH